MNVDKIRVYACGGTGVSIAEAFNDSRLDIAYIDTSTSDLSPESAKDAYLLPKMDGAGKMREKTYEAVVKNGEVTKILTMHAPSETLNIVIGSLSGGTGSVICPALVQDFVAKGLPFIVVGIVTDNDDKEITNCIKTLKTYNNLAHIKQRPIPMLYMHNEISSKTIQHVTTFVSYISLMTDKSRTRGFDTADLYNFLNYNIPVKDAPATLSLLDFVYNSDNLDDVSTNSKHADAIVVASVLITQDRDARLMEPTPLYSGKAVVTDGSLYVSDEARDIRVDNLIGTLNPVLQELEELHAKISNSVTTARLDLIEVEKGSVENDDIFVL